MDENESEHLDFIAENIPTGRSPHDASVIFVNFDNTGNLLAIGHWDRSISIFDLQTRTIKATTAAAHTGYIKSISWSPCNTRIATVSLNKEPVRFWEVETLQNIGSIHYGSTNINAIYNPRVADQVLIHTCYDVHLASQVLNDALKTTSTVEFEDHFLEEITFNKDGTYVLVATKELHERKTYILAVSENTLTTIAVIGVEVSKFLVPRDSDNFFVFDENGVMKVLNLSLLMRARAEEFNLDSLRRAAANVNYQPVVIPANYVELELDKTTVNNLMYHAAVNSSGTQIYFSDRTLVFWNPYTGAKIGSVRFPGVTNSFTVEKSPTRKQFIICSRDELILLSSPEALQGRVVSKNDLVPFAVFHEEEVLPDIVDDA